MADPDLQQHPAFPRCCLSSGSDKNCSLIYRMTLVNMGKQDKQGYTGYTETLELT